MSWLLAILGALKSLPEFLKALLAADKAINESSAHRRLEAKNKAVDAAIDGPGPGPGPGRDNSGSRLHSSTLEQRPEVNRAPRL